MHGAELEENLTRLRWMQRWISVSKERVGKTQNPGIPSANSVQFIAGGRGVFMPLGGMTRFFGASFVWLCTLGRGRGVKMHTQRPCGLECGMADFIKSNKEPDNRQGNKFLPALTVGEPLYGARLQAGEGANSCRESYWRYLGLKLLCPFFGDPEPLRSHSLGSCGSERTEDS